LNCTSKLIYGRNRIDEKQKDLKLTRKTKDEENRKVHERKKGADGESTG